MPNTPCLVGETAAAYCPGKHATDEDCTLVAAMFDAVGKCQRVTEAQLDGACHTLTQSPPCRALRVCGATIDLMSLTRSWCLPSHASMTVGVSGGHTGACW